MRIFCSLFCCEKDTVVFTTQESMMKLEQVIEEIARTLQAPPGGNIYYQGKHRFVRIQDIQEGDLIVYVPPESSLKSSDTLESIAKELKIVRSIKRLHPKSTILLQEQRQESHAYDLQNETRNSGEGEDHGDIPTFEKSCRHEGKQNLKICPFSYHGCTPRAMFSLDNSDASITAKVFPEDFPQRENATDTKLYEEKMSTPFHPNLVYNDETRPFPSTGVIMRKRNLMNTELGTKRSCRHISQSSVL